MRPTPPVLVRGGSGKITDKPSIRRPPRRRYDISVSTSTPGTEIRLPSLPSLRIGWRIVSGLISAAVIALIYFFLTSPEFQIQSVIIQGNNRLSTQEIISVINLVGGSIFEADPILMKQDLHTAFPELHEISVKIGFPAEVLVALRERDPVLAWKKGDQVSWIDSEGVEFPPRGQIGSLIKVESSVPPPAPRTNDMESDGAPFTQGSMSPEMVTAITTIKSQSPKGMPIIYDPQYGLGWKDPKGWEVYFGLDVFDIQMKLRVYQAIKAELKAQGINPSLISVEHIHAPYYRLEPGL
jgi:cell division protein FtsQ